MGLRDSQCDVLRRLVTHWRRLCSYRWAVSVESARFGQTVIMLFLVVAVDFTGRLMSVLADGVMMRGIVTLRWSVMKRNSLNNA